MSDSDEEEETEEPAVELGEGPAVEGAPLARIASRLTWPIERERLLEREGDSEIRTPDGPREVASVLEAVDVTYFDTRQTFVEAVRDAVGRGPVQTATAGAGDGTAGAEATTDDGTGGETGDDPEEPADDADGS